ncbi:MULTISPECIES: NB-ARC domain-containing protein [unclassified Leptolyngbya]|uniref:NB-ARC domain-containing protein n=1 Tax=unclassified Leptolyngbya TaxID=2650499 RepID=UPI001685F90C|nr:MULTISPECIES: NB-ARC domain-containing protein [unclassified Leptolyngbya]MBD1913398.1 hypothetical protein [Leptolyngbya sp. FACHB-8]MBD2158671.1 hypothetical protein [Leptolyngbya sp. FACHB-16]
MEVSQELFAAASETWNLQRLCDDLAIAKGSQLTPRERVYLKGLLLGYRPNDIANLLHVQSISARKYCSNLYAYIEDLLLTNRAQQASAAEVQTMGVRANRVAALLDQAGYRLPGVRVEELLPLSAPPATDYQAVSRTVEQLTSSSMLDEVPVLSVCYGRHTELATLTQFKQQGSRLITVYGDYGIGKTTLLKQWVHQVKTDFNRVIWRSLRGLPSCASLLADLLNVLVPERYTPSEEERHLSLLVNQLQQQRILLVLEDVDRVLEEESRLRRYRAGYESYELFFHGIAAHNHQSLIMLEAWEPLADLELLEKSTETVQGLKLKKLDQETAIKLLQDYELKDLDCWSDLIDTYRGNPYALRVVAAHIAEVFDGHVGEFCQDHTTYLGNISNLLHYQFKRLSGLEKDILFYLTQQDGNPISRPDLRQQFQSSESKSSLNEALEALSWRSLIERSRHHETTTYMASPVVMKYIKSCISVSR